MSSKGLGLFCIRRSFSKDVAVVDDEEDEVVVFGETRSGLKPYVALNISCEEGKGAPSSEL